MARQYYFRFYVRDWLSDPIVSGLDLQEKGIYITLLALLWNESNCSLPNDDRIARMLRMSTPAWRKKRDEFIELGLLEVVDSNSLVNPRLLREFGIFEDKSAMRSQAANVRWNKVRETPEQEDNSAATHPPRSALPKREQLRDQNTLDMFEGAQDASANTDKRDETAVANLTLIGDRNYPVTKDVLDTFQRLYPTISVADELRKMEAYLYANPNKRKTLRGIKSSINYWLSLAVDRGPKANHQQPAATQTSAPAPAAFKLGLPEGVTASVVAEKAVEPVPAARASLLSRLGVSGS